MINSLRINYTINYYNEKKNKRITSLAITDNYLHVFHIFYISKKKNLNKNRKKVKKKLFYLQKLKKEKPLPRVESEISRNVKGQRVVLNVNMLCMSFTLSFSWPSMF